eukprot:CAMPEP_0169266166 /NCGR_PEP_ID=MMETSP1016-20121227/46226_1 /TAXON_ID=342587 /ORGANISM="Karlodinium micrum, Strain CCMP2283" /LENGTH=123 /DNA_ID=CAMNT_0009350001 /DNA_START=132 /DNA_END=503 /DNA_ORIENTATION=+
MRKNASLQVIPPCSFDDALTSGGRMVVQFASCAAQLTGSCALADTVFNGFAKEVPEGVICAHCSDSSKSGIDPLPLLPPLFAVYDKGKVVSWLLQWIHDVLRIDEAYGSEITSRCCLFKSSYK